MYFDIYDNLKFTNQTATSMISLSYPKNRNSQFLFLSEKIHQIKPKKTAWCIWFDLILITAWIATEKTNYQNYAVNRSFSWNDLAQKFDLSEFVAKKRIDQLIKNKFLISKGGSFFLPTCSGDGTEVRLHPGRISDGSGLPIKRDFLTWLFDLDLPLRAKAVLLAQVIDTRLKISKVDGVNYRTLRKMFDFLDAAGLVKDRHWKTPALNILRSEWMVKIIKKGHYQRLLEQFILDNNGELNDLDNFYPLIKLYKRHNDVFRSFEGFLKLLIGDLSGVNSPAAVLLIRAKKVVEREQLIKKPAYMRPLQKITEAASITKEDISDKITRAKKILELAAASNLAPEISDLLRPGTGFWAAAVIAWAEGLGLSPPP